MAVCAMADGGEGDSASDVPGDGAAVAMTGDGYCANGRRVWGGGWNEDVMATRRLKENAIKVERCFKESGSSRKDKSTACQF